MAEESRRLAALVPETHRPDAIVFIARGGLVIGQAMAEVFQCPLCAVKAVREGSRWKEAVTPVLRLVPRSMRIWMREREVRSGIHAAHTARDVRFLTPVPDVNRILLVDDSVDTGTSMQQVCAALQAHCPAAIVEIAAINVFAKSEALIHTDYAIYRDTLVSTPASADNCEHEAFLRRWEAYEMTIAPARGGAGVPL